MAHPEHRFDALTEEFYDHQLEALRAFARDHMPDGPVSVEIGSNKGKFVRELAQAHPETDYIGLEIRRKYAEMAQASLDELGLTRAHVLRADAAHALPILFDDGQIQEMFILYPDPWWKARHRKRRVVREDMLDVFARKMAPGAPLWIRTDVGPLGHDMRDEIHAHPSFEPLELEKYPMTPFPYSERDVRTIRKGMPVNLLYFQRVA